MITREEKARKLTASKGLPNRNRTGTTLVERFKLLVVLSWNLNEKMSNKAHKNSVLSRLSLSRSLQLWFEEIRLEICRFCLHSVLHE